MNDVYNKPNKASRKQQINMRLTFLGDALRRNATEKIELLAEVVALEVEQTTLREKANE